MLVPFPYVILWNSYRNPTRHIFLHQNYRRGKTKTERDDLTCTARPLGQAGAGSGVLSWEDQCWKTASTLAWQCKREGESWSLVRRAWWRMLKKAGLLKLHRPPPAKIFKYKRGCHMEERVHALSVVWRKRFSTKMSRDGMDTSRGNKLPILVMYNK